MVQWEDPTLQARLAVANTNIIFVLLGLYGWEYLQSLDVECAVIRGRLPFRWPLIPYLVGRFSLFLFLLLLTIGTNPPSSGFNCLPGAVSKAIFGNISLAACSTNLMIRTWVIWKDSRLVHTVLLFLALGHWIILALDVANLQVSELNGGCDVYVVDVRVNAGVFVYSLGYDFFVLVLSIVGLSKQPSKSPLRKRLRAQGLAYFLVAVIAYIPPTVFAFLGVNLMVVVTSITVTGSTIASCRVMRSLLGLRTPGSSHWQKTEESLEAGVALTTQVPVQTITSSVVC